MKEKKKDNNLDEFDWKRKASGLEVLLVIIGLSALAFVYYLIKRAGYEGPLSYIVVLIFMVFNVSAIIFKQRKK